MVAPGAALLSPRGDVLERGMPRFFRRFAEGVFDEDDVRRRADALADFVTDARKAYGIATPVALGYSNGANIAAAVLLLRPGVLAGAILWRAMMPLAAPQPTSLSGAPVLMVSGARDLIAAPAEADRLKAALEAAGAAVEHRVLPVGHELSQADVTIARQWMQQQRFGENAAAAAVRRTS